MALGPRIRSQMDRLRVPGGPGAPTPMEWQRANTWHDDRLQHPCPKSLQWSAESAAYDNILQICQDTVWVGFMDTFWIPGSESFWASSLQQIASQKYVGRCGSSHGSCEKTEHIKTIMISPIIHRFFCFLLGSSHQVCGFTIWYRMFFLGVLHQIPHDRHW